MIPREMVVEQGGGKQQDMAGYVILKKSRVGLSFLFACLFGGRKSFRMLRRHPHLPQPWMKTIFDFVGNTKLDDIEKACAQNHKKYGLKVLTKP